MGIKYTIPSVGHSLQHINLGSNVNIDDIVEWQSGEKMSYPLSTSLIKTSFEGSDTIREIYGEAGQDLFVISLLNGKKNGTYLEIGTWHSKDKSNTYLLESKFGWKGASVDIDLRFVQEHNRNRKNQAEVVDATKANYIDVLHRAGIYDTDIDYATVDCEPASNTFLALKKMPFDTHRFGVITYEHDAYAGQPQYRTLSREFLRSRGYMLLVPNVSFRGNANTVYEDWWVHPELISQEAILKFKSDVETVNNWKDIVLNKSVTLYWDGQIPI